MEKIEINNCVYKLHPVYDLYASNEAGKVINIVKKCPMTGTKNHNGYNMCAVRKHGQKGQKQYYVHRFVWECFNGLIPEGKVIDHENDIKTDNRLCNLQQITQQENCKKSAKHRDYSFVSKNHNNRKCVKAVNQTNNKTTYFYSMYAVQKQLCINVGVVKMACDGINNCKSGISKLNGDRYTFQYINRDDMPSDGIKSRDIYPKKVPEEIKKAKREEYLKNWQAMDWLCSKCGYTYKNKYRYCHKRKCK